MLQSAGFHAGVVLFSVGAGLWFAYFRLKEASTPSPFLYRLLALCGGLASLATAFVGFQSIDALGFELEWATLQHSLDRAVMGALTLGFVEEGSKLLPVLLLALLSRSFRRASEGLVFAACAGVGFATAESTSLWMQGELDTPHMLARAIAAPLTHALFAAPWGLGLGLALKENRTTPLVQGFFLSVVAHGLYDLLLARPDIPRGSASLVVLALWMWILTRKRRAHVPLRGLALVPFDAAPTGIRSPANTLY